MIDHEFEQYDIDNAEELMRAKQKFSNTELSMKKSVESIRHVVEAKNRGEFEKLEERIVNQIENIQRKVTILDVMKTRLTNLV